MTFFSAFAVSFGALLALMATIAAWLFRTSGAPLAAKLAVPAALVALACYAPFAVNSMLGFPVSAGLSALPDHAELIAFFPHDQEGVVDLWLIPGSSPDLIRGPGTGPEPRAYEAKLDADMKHTLRAAQERMRNGQPAVLAKKGRGSSTSSEQARRLGDPLGVGDDQTTYVLDESAASALPAKE